MIVFLMLLILEVFLSKSILQYVLWKKPTFLGQNLQMSKLGVVNSIEMDFLFEQYWSLLEFFFVLSVYFS